jgi:hypothetical protein
MKTAHLLATLIAATLPLASIVAEDSGKTDTTDQRQEQNSDMMAMKGMMGKGQMSNDSLPPRSGFPFSSTALLGAIIVVIVFPVWVHVLHVFLS